MFRGGPASAATSAVWTAYVGTETRQYNSLLQLTRETVPGLKDMQYIYPSGANNGCISESIDAVTGEDVQYTYDSLQRLILAQTTNTGPQWGDAYAYDGFGNLLSKTVTRGSAPMMSASYGKRGRIFARVMRGAEFGAGGSSSETLRLRDGEELKGRMRCVRPGARGSPLRFVTGRCPGRQWV